VPRWPGPRGTAPHGPGQAPRRSGTRHGKGM